MFTKQHYKAIAHELAQFEEAIIYKPTLVTVLHVLFEKDNPEFDGEKWHDACYAETLYHY